MMIKILNKVSLLSALQVPGSVAPDGNELTMCSFHVALPWSLAFCALISSPKTMTCLYVEKQAINKTN